MSNRIGIYALLTGASCAISGLAVAQDDQRLVVPLSDPSRPARLEIQLFSGDISVEGYDGKEVVIVADAPIHDADRPEPARQDGLRRIQSSAVGLTVEENDNTVLVRMDFSPKNADLQIRVPRRTSVKASLVNGGDVEIDSVTGDHELANVNGDVIATDIAGSAVINATNGDVRATFTSVEAMKPMSFTSFNGDVDVTLPANIKADLIVGSQQGDVYTDFDVVSQTDPPNVTQRVGPRGGREVRVSHQTRYAVGGGGSDIELRTFNGDVMIRKR
jgi:putative adhesin